MNVHLPNGELGKQVPGYDGYVATKSGDIWSCRKRGPGNGFSTQYTKLVGGVDKDGYKKIIICHKRVRRYFRVHTLILLTFVGACPPGHEGRHKNGQRNDNRLTNVMWSTHVENIADKRKHGTSQCGERNPNARFTVIEVQRVKRLLKLKLTPSVIADRVNVPVTLVYNIKYHGNWAHVKI